MLLELLYYGIPHPNGNHKSYLLHKLMSSEYKETLKFVSKLNISANVYLMTCSFGLGNFQLHSFFMVSWFLC